MSAENPRSYTCQCNGKVSIPSGRRTITLDQVRATHNESCPAQRRVKQAA